MMAAALTVRPAPEAGPDARRFVVDCRHGTTEAYLVPGAVALAEAQVIRYLLQRHYAEECCACTAGLRFRYGLVGRDQ